MFADHAGDIVAQFGVARTGHMSAGEFDGGRKVVESVCGPDAEIMERGGQRNFLERGVGTGRERDAEIHHAIGVIAIRGEIASQLDRVRFEHAIERVQPFEQHRGYRLGNMCREPAPDVVHDRFLADVIQRIVEVALVQLQRLVLRTGVRIELLAALRPRDRVLRAVDDEQWHA